MVVCKDHIVYCSEQFLFSVEPGKSDLSARRAQGSSHKQKVQVLAANSNAAFASSLDKVFSKYELEGDLLNQSATVELNSAAISIAAGEDTVYVLKINGELDEIDANNLVVKKTIKPEFEGTALVFSEITQELWVGDKKGKIHVLNNEDYSEVHLFEKHTKAITALAVNSDGTKVASGDAYRYIYVHDAQSKAELHEVNFHKDKIESLCFADEVN